MIPRRSPPLPLPTLCCHRHRRRCMAGGATWPARTSFALASYTAAAAAAAVAVAVATALAACCMHATLRPWRAPSASALMPLSTAVCWPPLLAALCRAQPVLPPLPLPSPSPFLAGGRASSLRLRSRCSSPERWRRWCACRAPMTTGWRLSRCVVGRGVLGRGRRRGRRQSWRCSSPCCSPHGAPPPPAIRHPPHCPPKTVVSFRLSHFYLSAVPLPAARLPACPPACAAGRGSLP